ncbi:hypothetical protein TWF694_010398 [Orbilia ellipsospora]|uniref:Phosphoglycerate mutase n=1 Tax=Orbilia ellipsospora TaxID=2528407 RepID=A0AAV9XG12_9PEZI
MATSDEARIKKIRDPRLYIVRHGETEWSLSGQHTSVTDLPLTEHGKSRITKTGVELIGVNKLIDPTRIGKIYVSPRLRAQQTLSLLSLPEHIPIETVEDLAEFNYGTYEGLTSKKIKEISNNPNWEIYVHGGGQPTGETPQQVSDRVDRMIKKVREDHHKAVYDAHERCISTGSDSHLDDPVLTTPDVLFVAHGHVLRALAARWLGLGIENGKNLQLDAGGVGLLSYEHHAYQEPVIGKWNWVPLGK